MKFLKYLLFIIVAFLLILLVDIVFFYFMKEYASMGILMQIIIAIASGTLGLAMISLATTWVTEYISEISPSLKFASRTFIILSILNVLFWLIFIWQEDNLGVFASIVLSILILFITFSFCSANTGPKISAMMKEKELI
ncbi:MULTISPECIES: hypothetical protein [Bizionia]|uniref:DUF2975 domain-containing protein n=1 Tax=Bizionia algoritergicola TaxID=291187 RepID=A0A5D0R0U2_9FLAO|nr:MULTISPECIES: hypothetical protein [Bizionia]TYB75150.1 hypothetical protein ES675_03205 [Bizionia algoritergicola]